MKEIKLTQGKCALVSDDVFSRVSAYKWCARRSRNTFYAYRNIILPDGKRTLQAMHQFLLPGVNEIDHVDGDGLNNQPDNIRPATASQNRANQKKRTGCAGNKGVSWDKKRKLWLAGIQVGGRRLNLGRYEDETDAAHVYDYAARIYFGEFAWLNFP